MVVRLYSQALDYGILPDEFWDYSIGEIFDLLESKKRMYQQEMKEKISMNFILSRLIGNQVEMMLVKDAKTIYPWDMYPKIFADEKIQFEQAQGEKEVHQVANSRKAYAAEYMKRKRGG